GLDQVLAGKDNIEQTAQEITKGLLDESDLIVFVTDVTEGSRQEAVGSSFDKPVVFVENKGDLLQGDRNAGIQECKDSGTQELKPQASSLKSIRISAKENVGIDKLVDAILDVLDVDELAIGDVIAFTSRQYDILTQLSQSESIDGNKQKFQRLLDNFV
ncbi:MAG: hypothetical protein ACYSUT_12380, partial [Planctomycetota bacterium]